jgi:hypothetical protein
MFRHLKVKTICTVNNMGIVSLNIEQVYSVCVCKVLQLKMEINMFLCGKFCKVLQWIISEEFKILFRSIILFAFAVFKV